MEQFKSEQDPKKEKPTMLYHGSQEKRLRELHPQMENVRNQEEGALVFGTPDKAFAIMYLSPRPNDSWSMKLKPDDEWHFIIGDKERFVNGDNGGSIYTMSSKEFECDEGKGMGKTEWHSQKSIPLTREEDYPSTLQALIENGVRVYFVDKEKLCKLKKAIEKSKDDYAAILQSLQSETL